MSLGLNSVKDGAVELGRRIALPGGEFWMGSNEHYPEERPQRRACVDAFDMDAYPVTVAQFCRFVAETGWVTQAEQQGSSHVFCMTAGPVNLTEPGQWWKAVEGASWKNPRGLGVIPGLEASRLPVTHLSLHDAKAYALWAGGRLPTEAEWEFAARGGLMARAYAWGDEFEPQGQRMAHVWRGAFPWYHASMETPAPVDVGQFPPNGFGLYDMIGNVWEWTSSAFSTAAEGSCCSCSPVQDANTLWTLKGGSHLCAAEYCLRYRPAARIGVHAQASTSHMGLRCVYSNQANLTRL